MYQVAVHGGERVFAEWVTQGVGIGIRIFAAAFTLIVILGVFIGFMGIGAWLGKELSDETEKRNKPL